MVLHLDRRQLEPRRFAPTAVRASRVRTKLTWPGEAVSRREAVEQECPSRRTRAGRPRDQDGRCKSRTDHIKLVEVREEGEEGLVLVASLAEVLRCRLASRHERAATIRVITAVEAVAAAAAENASIVAKTRNSNNNGIRCPSTLARPLRQATPSDEVREGCHRSDLSSRMLTSSPPSSLSPLRFSGGFRPATFGNG